MRTGLLAGAIFIAAAINVAGAGAARAACLDLIVAFDRAVAEGAVDAAVSGFKDIGADPSAACLGRLAVYRARLADFLIDYANAPDTTAAGRFKAVATAERVLVTGANWRRQRKLGDYYFAHGDREKAFEWYRLSASGLAGPGAPVPNDEPRATDKERRDLTTTLAAVWSLGDDHDRRPLVPKCIKCVDPFTFPEDLLRVEAAAVPIPIRFVDKKTTRVPAGDEAMRVLAEVARESASIRLIGHVASRGRTREANMALSMRRVVAVRDELVKSGVSVPITFQSKGDQEPFDVSVLPDHNRQLSQDDIWQLDDRIEVTLQRR
jgi:outer membrane protein OmpA-like peptidoglycan-associated protein